LQRKGHEVSILCQQFDPSCLPLLSPNLKLSVSGKKMDFFRNRYANAVFDYFRTSNLLDLLPANIDAVCCFGPALTLLPKIKASKKVPVLYFCYEPPRFLYTDRQIILNQFGVLRLIAGPLFESYRQKDQHLVKTADRVLSNSEFGRKQIKEIYQCDARVITHGLDPYRQGTERKKIRESLQVSDSDVLAMSANYLHPRKRLELFLQTVKEAGRSNPSIKGVLIGDGPDRSRLEKLANGSVRFTGFVPEESLNEYFQAAEIYLHTGRLETFGLSVIEASANYLPVVSVNEGGPTETVIPGKTGVLCDATSSSLGAGLLMLANSKEQRRLFGENGYRFVRERYSWERGAEDFLSAIHEVL
jgi:glycosyltransferase involved in cell wall biosynthesis